VCIQVCIVWIPKREMTLDVKAVRHMAVPRPAEYILLFSCCLSLCPLLFFFHYHRERGLWRLGVLYSLLLLDITSAAVPSIPGSSDFSVRLQVTPSTIRDRSTAALVIFSDTQRSPDFAIGLSYRAHGLIQGIQHRSRTECGFLQRRDLMSTALTRRNPSLSGSECSRRGRDTCDPVVVNLYR